MKGGGAFMIMKKIEKNRGQLQIMSIDDLVPQGHMLRLIDKAIDWSLFTTWLRISIVKQLVDLV